LFLPLVTSGRDPVNAKMLRVGCRGGCWQVELCGKIGVVNLEAISGRVLLGRVMEELKFVYCKELGNIQHVQLVPKVGRKIEEFNRQALAAERK